MPEPRLDAGPTRATLTDSQRTIAESRRTNAKMSKQAQTGAAPQPVGFDRICCCVWQSSVLAPSPFSRTFVSRLLWLSVALLVSPTCLSALCVLIHFTFLNTCPLLRSHPT